jgi:hypothetical protein
MNHYFYIDAEGKQKGTFSPEELRQEGIRRDTLVWTRGMEQWKRAEEIEELGFLFSDAYSRTQTTSGQSYARYGQPGETGRPPVQQQPKPKTWLVESILVTFLPFFFCGSVLSLLGIIAIVYASQVESFYNRGDYMASQESSRSAAKWTKISLWIVIGWTAFLVIATILAFVLIGGVFSTFSGIGNMLNT